MLTHVFLFVRMRREIYCTQIKEVPSPIGVFVNLTYSHLSFVNLSLRWQMEIKNQRQNHFRCIVGSTFEHFYKLMASQT